MGNPEPANDELEESIRRFEAEHPGFRELREDMKEIHAVLDFLVARRRDLDLSQKWVADHMGIKQPTVSEFESEASDPKLSTLQRYARAVGGRIVVSFVDCTEADVLTRTEVAL